MTTIIIPRKHLDQPRGRLAIDDRSPFAVGLKLAAGSDVQNAVTGAPGVLSATAPKVVAGPAGLALSAASTSSFLTHDTSQSRITDLGVGGALSIFALADRAGVDSRNKFILQFFNLADSTGSNYAYLGEGGGYGSANFVFRGGSGLSTSANSTVNGPSDKPTGYGGVITEAGARAYCGSRLDGSAAFNSAAAFSNTRVEVLGITASWPGRLYAAFVWQGFELTPNAFIELQYNPWQVFRADPIRIYSLPSGPITLGTPRFLRVTSSGFGVELDLS